MVVGDVDKRGVLVPSESLSSLDSLVSDVGGGAVAVRSTLSPPFGYVRVLGMSPSSGSVTPVSSPFECQSILLCNPTSTHTMRHNLYVTLLQTTFFFTKEVLVYLDASLQEV